MEKKAMEIFEAGKTAYHCNMCDTNMMLYPEQPKKCPCGSTDLKQLSKQESDQIIKEDKTQVHVIIGLYGGVVQDVEVFTDDKKATEYEKKICEEYGVPFDSEERDQYYDSDGENEVKHLITEVRE